MRSSVKRSSLLLIGFLVATGCQNNENEQCVPTPSPCISTVPDHSLLYIHVSNPVPWVQIYSGANYETGTLIWSGWPALGTKDWSMALPLGDYAATARYVVDSETILAVDGTTLDFSELETCNATCYTVNSGAVDLALDSILFPHSHAGK